MTLQKLDPYLNIDPGTMSPFQHGEVFVTDDGAETDLDLGHYERFTGVSVTRSHNVTAGQIYDSILSKERRGDYLGPHGPGHPARHRRDQEAHLSLWRSRPRPTSTSSRSAARSATSSRCRSSKRSASSSSSIGATTLFVHVTLVPFIKAAGEMKTKPTQHSVKELREIGIQPDILLCRSEQPLTSELREKIALFCNVPTEAVIDATDVQLDLRGAAACSTTAGSTRWSCASWGSRPANPT